MFKEIVKTEVKTEIIETKNKVFEMQSLVGKDGLIMLIPTSLSLENKNFVNSLTNRWNTGRVVPRELLFSTDFVAYFNRKDCKHNKILILRNRWTGDTGVFDYE